MLVPASGDETRKKVLPGDRVRQDLVCFINLTFAFFPSIPRRQSIDFTGERMDLYKVCSPSFFFFSLKMAFELKHTTGEESNLEQRAGGLCFP